MDILRGGLDDRADDDEEGAAGHAAPASERVDQPPSEEASDDVADSEDGKHETDGGAGHAHVEEIMPLGHRVNRAHYGAVKSVHAKHVWPPRLAWVRCTAGTGRTESREKHHAIELQLPRRPVIRAVLGDGIGELYRLDLGLDDLGSPEIASSRYGYLFHRRFLVPRRRHDLGRSHYGSWV